MNFGTWWVALVTFLSPAALLAILIMTTGCAGNVGVTKVRTMTVPSAPATEKSEAIVQACYGISWVFGTANNGCELKTGGISIPGLEFVLGVVDAVKGFSLGLLGQSESPAPIFNFEGVVPVPVKIEPESD